MKCFMTGRECNYRSDTVAGVFMLSPFGFPFDDLYEQSLQPTLKQLNQEIDRADKALQLGYVMCQRICQPIQKAEYVLADLSVSNANVYYELGLAYSLGKKLVIIKNKQLPHTFQNLFSDDSQHTSAIIDYTSIKDLSNSLAV